MPGPPSSEFTEMTMIFSGSGLPHGAACTLGVETPADSAARSTLAALLVGTWREMSSNDITCERVDFKVGPEATGPTYSVQSGLTGLDTAEPAGPQVTWLVRKEAFGFSNRFAGRMYLPGITEGGVQADGSILPAAVEYMQGLWDDFFTLANGPFYIFRSGAGSPRLVGGFTVDGRVATQRRRNRR